MKRLCTICARAGSKGVKNKNIRMLAGKPLLAHSVELAKRSELFDVIAVSSDSDDILAVARDFGSDILITRPDSMALDTSAKMPAIQHCASEVEKQLGLLFDTFVDLDATSPLRKIEDIAAVLSKLEEPDTSNVITGTPARRSPYFNLVEEDDLGIVFLAKTLPEKIIRRQDAPKCYDMNASIYAWRRHAFFNDKSLFTTGTRIVVMPDERSIDIDTELDFRIVEYLMTNRC